MTITLGTSANLHSALTDVSTPHVAADIAAGQVIKKVSETTLTAAATTISLTGLDLETDKVYEIYMFWVKSTAADTTIRVFFNGDTTTNHYYQSAGANTGGAWGHLSQADPQIMYGGTDTGSAFLRLTVMKLASYKTRVTFTSGSFAAATYKFVTGQVVYTTDATNLTQLDLTASQADALAIGTKVIVFKGN